MYVANCPSHNKDQHVRGKNWIIISALDELNKRENSNSNSDNENKENKQQSGGVLKEKCRRCAELPATIYCEWCDQDRCDKCDASVHTGEWSSHQRHSVAEKAMHAIPRCDHHQHQHVTHYCHQCKKLICQMCKDAKTLCSTHPTESIEDVKAVLINDVRQQLSIIAPVVRSHANNLLHGEEMEGAVKHWCARMINLVNQTINAFQNEYKQYVGDSEPVRKSYSISAAKAEPYVLEAERLLNAIQSKNAKESKSKYGAAGAVRQLQLVLQNLDTAKKIESEELKSFRDQFLSIKCILNRTKELCGELLKEINALGSILKPLPLPIDSLIINNKNILCRLFEMDTSQINFVLLYRGSRDGFTAQVFHSLCDNKGATIMIIRTTNNEVFGGYISIPWISRGHQIDLKDGTAWLFALTNNNNNNNNSSNNNNNNNNNNGKNEQGAGGDEVGIIKLFPSVNSYSSYALIYDNPANSPIFGYTTAMSVHDIFLYADMTTNQNYYRRGLFSIGESIPYFPNAHSNCVPFTVKEIEIFHVDIQT